MFDPESLKIKARSQSRKIIHIDMDSFFASVEMRDFPEYRNIPLAVGGDPGRRGVLSTCNYIARKFGVRSAMPSAHALRLCPDLKIIPGRMSAYKEASLKVHDVLQTFSENIEPMSIDEAYIDVTDSQLHFGSATLMAKQIRKDVFDATALTCSAGAAPNKFLAKIASEWNKPNGLFTIPPHEVDLFMREIPLRKLPGIGIKTANTLESYGLKTCHDIQKADLFTMIRRYGKWAHRLYELSFGYDDNPIETTWQRKSLGVEETFLTDLVPDECQGHIGDIYEEMCARLDRYLKREPTARALKAFVKIKTHDFKLHTFERILDTRSKTPPKVEDYSIMLGDLLARYQTPVRLIGLGVRLCYEEGPEQLSFSMALEA